jgi:hypothetical protein
MAYTGNKPTNVVDVSETQSLTVDGDLTVDTTTLKVDSTNNRVGVGTDTPDTIAEIRGANPIVTIRDTETSSGSAEATLRLAETGASDSLGSYWDIKASGGSLHFIDNWDEGGGTGTRVTLTDSGNVGIGTTSPNTKLDIVGSSTNGSGIVDTLRLRNTGTTQNDGARIQFTAGSSTSGAGIGSGGQALNSADLRFYAGGNTERMRIESAGNIVQTASGSASWQYALNCTASSGQLLGHLVQFTAQAPNNNSNFFLYMTDNVGPRAYFTADGGLHNYQGNNSNLSDEREKKNIEDAQDAWATVKSWQVRKFHFNEDADSDDKRYGVIAQEFETSCPELISEFNRSPDPTSESILRKGVKEQGAMWLAIKALQEAQVKIETLETKVTTLETQNADLETKVADLETKVADFETRLTALEAG